MILDSLLDAKILDMESNTFDLAFFTIDHQKRSNHILNNYNFNIKNRIIFLFEKDKDFCYDSYKNDSTRIIFLEEGKEDLILYQILNEIDNRENIKILIDYTVIKPVLLSSFLNWARFINCFNTLELHFLYSVGNHREKIEPARILDILALPGFEGGSQSGSKSVSIFGLGFDGPGSLCIYDRLEPDETISFIASPGAFQDYVNRAKESNKEMIEENSNYFFEFPLRSVETTFRYLAEVISPYRTNSDITIIPLGPKPHVLSSLLVSLRFEEVLVLYLKSDITVQVNTDTTEELVATQVNFIKRKL